MKSLFIALAFLTLALSINANASSCSINLITKTEKATSGFIANVNFSKKQLEALSKVCSISRQTMDVNQLVELERSNFEAKIARLTKTKTAKK